jgi:hypothetical protein
MMLPLATAPLPLAATAAVAVAACFGVCIRPVPLARSVAVAACGLALAARMPWLGAGTVATAWATGVALHLTSAGGQSRSDRVGWATAALLVAVGAVAPVPAARVDAATVTASVLAATALVLATSVVLHRGLAVPVRGVAVAVFAALPFASSAGPVRLVDGAAALALDPGAATWLARGTLHGVAAAPIPALEVFWRLLPVLIALGAGLHWVRQTRRHAERPHGVTLRPWIGAAGLVALAAGIEVTLGRSLAISPEGAALVRVPGRDLPVPLHPLGAPALDVTLACFAVARTALCAWLAVTLVAPDAPADRPGRAMAGTAAALLALGALWSFTAPGQHGATWHADPAAHAALAAVVGAGVALSGAFGRPSWLRDMGAVLAMAAGAVLVGGSDAGWAVAGRLALMP